MAPCDLKRRPPKSAAALCRAGRATMSPAGRLIAAFAALWTLLQGASSPVLSQDGPDWTGKRVVPKSRSFVLRSNDEPVERSGKGLDIYAVEQTDGAALLLKAESQGAAGSATTADVVPLANAIEYFTDRIRTQPRDAFAYAMRAAVRHDKNELDVALRDFDQAIELDPRDPFFYCGRGGVWQSRQAHKKAIADFALAIRLDPKSTLAYIGRGKSRAAEKDLTGAIADFSEAVWLDPLSIAGYVNRGLAWHSKREYEKAISDFNLSVRLDPQYGFAFCQRGKSWGARKRFGQAIADFNEAVRLDPRDAEPQRALAWLLATCPDPTIRNGVKAVQAATKACELTQWKDAAALDTLAAACATAGDFEAAVKWQLKAIALGLPGENARQREARLLLYRQQQPYREAIPWSGAMPDSRSLRRTPQRGEATALVHRGSPAEKPEVSPPATASARRPISHQTPLKFSATNLMPCFSPIDLTASSLAGTVRLRRGEMQIPQITLGMSSGLLAVPSTARPLSTSGEAFSIRT
jgi:tetratricopeptide (TPR) repeat protein